MRRKLPTIALAGAVLTATIAFAPAASAGLCSDLAAGPPIVYVENGDTQEPLIKRLGYRLANSATPVRIVYKNLPTCTLAADLYTPNPMVLDAARPVRYIPTAAEAPTFTPLSASPTCDPDPGGNEIGLGIGATFLSSCANLAGITKQANLVETTGPVEAYGFIVPTGSSQIAITAEEGFFAYGYGAGDGMAAPWLDQALRFSRASTASTALATAAAIGPKSSQLKGTIPVGNTSTEVLSFVATSAAPEATIGIMGGDIFDGSRNLVKVLAFKGFRQRYAYFPDSSATAFDKKNVRDGHYLPWAPTPYLAVTDPATGKATDPNVQRIIDLVLGTRVDTDVNGVDQVIASGLVPQCAMGVQRGFDGDDLKLYSAPQSCSCYFEAHAPQSTTKCQKCPTGTCAAGVCRNGYCEAR